MSEAAGSGHSRKEQALRLFAGLPRRYDLLSAALSFGQDPRWRRAMVERVPVSARDRVVDVATGTGLVAAQLVRRYGCSVVGVDQSAEMLTGARARLERDPELGRHVELVQGEAEQLPFADGEFDGLTFTYLLRYVEDPASTMRELARVLRPGAPVGSVEFGVPKLAPLRGLWNLYTRLGLPALGRLVSRDWYEVGRFLGPSISELERSLPPEKITELWRAAGIGSVGIRRMSLGAGVVMWGVRDGGR